MKVKNVYTDTIYEAIEYSYERFKECKKFITDNMDISISLIIPKMRMYGLKSYESITEIKPTDFIIRTITDGIPLYNTVSKDVMENNYNVVEE